MASNNGKKETQSFQKHPEDPTSPDRPTIEEVALVVPETDDPALPVMTFRAWFLGITSCTVLMSLNTFFTYRTQPLTISAILMQIAVLPIGKFMASSLPTKQYKLMGWGFSVNPGPFNMKEHVIITIFANCGVSYGGGDAYSIGAITVMKVYYKQRVGFYLAFVIVLTTQILGWAGMLRKYLVEPAEMWWPSNLVQVSLFSDIWRQSKSAMNSAKMDIHARLMKNYKEVPQWWFLILLVGSVALSLLMSFVWKKDVQLPWWGMLFAFVLAWIISLPIGVIQATTNQQPGYDIISQFIIGYILPGKPIANLLFKIYGRISTIHVLSFLSDLKLGHYMKIPPRCMFTAQLAGTLISGTVNLAVAWWMLGSIENICDVEALHPESPWTCPKFRVTFDSSVIWGLIGPRRLFGPGGMYRNLVWLFLVGAVLPVPIWILSKIYPEKKWIPLINIPVISYGFAGMPPATPTNISSWLITGTIFNFFVFRYRKGWWKKYNYVLSAALDAGTAFMGVLLYFALQNENVSLKWWGTNVDHCPLAKCPTQPGISVKGCPVF